MSRTRKMVGSVVILLMSGAAGWGIGGAIRSRDDQQAPTLAIGDRVPNIDLPLQSGGSSRLWEMDRFEADHVLLVLAATCSTCLGELASWNELAKRSAKPGLTVLVYAPDSAWFLRTTDLVRPVFRFIAVNPEIMDSVGTRLTPTAYLLDSDWRIKSIHLGIAETAALRTKLDHAPALEEPLERGG